MTQNTNRYVIIKVAAKIKMDTKLKMNAKTEMSLQKFLIVLAFHMATKLK